MEATLELTHERVDDVPLLLGFLIQLRFPEVLDRHLPPHPLHQGLSNGWLITVWIAYILSQADHRKSYVQPWVEGLQHTIETIIGQLIRPVEFSDDRLTLVLKRLSDLEVWHELEADLWLAQCEVYALPPVERVRLDATTTYGYHAIDDDGLMQLGHSKDHRPDLPQIKLMAAAAEPSGLFLAGDVHPGNAADDPLYLPLYWRVRALLGQTGLLYAGDCKMAALETRAEIAANQDFYLTRLPLTGEVSDQFAAWVEAALTGEQAAKLVEIQRDDELIGTGYEFERSQSAVIENAEHTWTERVQIIRSEALAQSQAAALERRMEKAEAAVRGLTPPPGPRRTQFKTGWELEQAVAAILTEHDVEGLLEVNWDREETSRTHYVGRGRSGPNRPKTTEWDIRYQITTVRRNDKAIQQRVARLGWQVQVTNTPASRLSLPDSQLTYRGGWCVERIFHLFKDKPLGIRPLFVWRDDQVQGLTHLVTLALRVLMLFEVLVRQGQDQSGEKLEGMYPGQPKRETDRPTAKRVLEAISRAQITLTQVESGDERRWHLSALPMLVRQVLGYIGLSHDVYTRLAINSG
ncbi:MAG TPA: IS1634 family transposase [Candidatus Methylomirabilis sp.]|nr:IS1634 family transposase [Candidatus Methylomirabilis sp.]